MSFANPSDGTEILYGSSGDVRDEINSFVAATNPGHYFGEEEIPGSLIIKSLVKSTRIINAFLEPVYADSIPFSVAANVPKLLEEIGSDIATYYVFRSSVAKLGQLPDEKRISYYDDYMNSKDGLLTRIAKKEIGLAELTSVSPLDAKSIRGAGRHAIFDIDDETSQGADPDLLDDIAKDRES